MRILTPVQHMSPVDGVAVQTFQVCQALVERGHEVCVGYLNDGGEWEGEYQTLSLSLDSVPHLEAPVRRPKDALRGAAEGLVLGRRRRPDVVYDNLGWSLLTMSAAAMAARAPIVSHVHGFNPDAGGPGKAGARLIARTKRIIAVSSWMRDKLADYDIDRPDIAVVHNGIDPAAFPVGTETDMRDARARLGLSPSSYLVLYYGRLHETKGVHVLIEALASLVADGEDVELVVMGHPAPGYLEQLQAQADILRTHWWPARPDVVDILHAADVVVAPSLWQEPFGRVVIEALATGRPIVASRVGGIPEILAGGLEELLVPPGETAALATTLKRLRWWRRNDPDLARRCRTRVEESFTFDRMVDAIEATLTEAAR